MSTNAVSFRSISSNRTKLCALGQITSWSGPARHGSEKLLTGMTGLRLASQLEAQTLSPVSSRDEESSEQMRRRKRAGGEIEGEKRGEKAVVA